MNTVISHSADWDGRFCEAIALKFLPFDTKFIGWDFGQPKVDGLELPEVGSIYVMDLPIECLNLTSIDLMRLTWIDHHKSSIENTDPLTAGFRIDGVAACRLAWQYFTVGYDALPKKEKFLTRSVDEPLAVTLAGEYDVWQHGNSGGDDITFQFGLDSAESLDWPMLLDAAYDSEQYVNDLLDQGETAQRCYAKRDADIVTTRGFDIEFEGLLFRALNTAQCNSQSFVAAIRPEHDGCLAFYFNGKTFVCSLYGVEHKPDLDLSTIAVKYGGGGHRAACGFSLKDLPF